MRKNLFRLEKIFVCIYRFPKLKFCNSLNV